MIPAAGEQDLGLMTPDQLGGRWNVSVGHLRNLRYLQKGLPYLKLGGRVAYRVSDVLAYEAECLVAPSAETLHKSSNRD